MKTTPLLRKTPFCHRRTPLARVDYQLKKSPIARVGKKAKPRKPRKRMKRRSTEKSAGDAIWADVTAAAIDECGGLCQINAHACTRWATEGHHWLPRGQGGPNTRANCKPACHNCHEYATTHPTWAYANRATLRRESEEAKAIKAEVEFAGGLLMKVEPWTDPITGAAIPLPSHKGRFHFSKVWSHAAIRAAVHRRDGFACCECGLRVTPPANYDGRWAIYAPGSVCMMIDHIVSLNQGGTNHPDNLRTLCERCNCRKGATIDKVGGCV